MSTPTNNPHPNSHITRAEAVEDLSISNNNGNGNDSPPNELQLVDSDTNLSPDAVRQFNRFVSAKNSVEFHRDRALGRNHSFPRFFGFEEDYDYLTERFEGPRSAKPSTSTDDPTRTHCIGKTVSW